MKNFEEKFAAWTDDALSDAERQDFERELSAHPEAEHDRLSALHLGEFLRTHHPVPALPNPDFFNQRILQQIEVLAPPPASEKSGRAFPVWKLVWGGALCLLAAAALFQFAVPHGAYTSDGRDVYLVEVIEAHTGSDSIYASSFHAKKNNVTVLWLDGLPYIPDTYAAK